MPPGAASAAGTACRKVSLKVLLRDLGQAVRIGDVPVHEQPAPASLHRVEVPPMERDARADDLHVSRAVPPDGAAGTVRDAVLLLEPDLLLEEEVRELTVRGELEAERLDHLLVEVAQRALPRLDVHGRPPSSPRSSVYRAGWYPSTLWSPIRTNGNPYTPSASSSLMIFACVASSARS